ncbi:hypothetical protein AB9F29_02655 [Falsihalocynthiibacter sp. S25ZX9]|uniref:hypothetical protein n=1 Tax=Falsihalocynthiibacter sp. S25ZX9 TaxID=3240870 RepID=UPI0035107C71
MRFPTYLIVSLGLATGACSSVSDSRYNPMNWGQSEDIAATLAPEDGYLVLQDNRNLIAQVTNLTVVNAQGGVIVHATGLPPTQGYFDAELFPRNEEKPEGATLVYEFRVLEPNRQQRVSSEVSREVIVAHFISTAKLRGVNEIKIVAAQNSRSSRAQ